MTTLNITRMKPSQLVKLLAKSIAARLPVLITGAPGIGKSDIIAQVCAMLGANLIISHPAVADPTDAKGLPWAEKGAKFATFLPFGDLAQAMAATSLTVWLLDDLGQATPAVQASFMQLILARRVNGHVLPDCVVFIAATNRRTDRAGVAGILEPVKSRFATIVELVVDTEEWCQWALQQSYIPPDLVAYHRFRQADNMLCQFNPSADLTNSPLPRTWASVGKLIGLDLSPDVEQAAIAGAVGEAAATDYLGFRRMYRQLPALQDIITSPKTALIPDNLAARYAVAVGVAALTTVDNFPNVAIYATRLNEAGAGDFGALIVMDASRKTPAIQQTPEFVRIIAGPLGALMSGDAQRVA